MPAQLTARHPDLLQSPGHRLGGLCGAGEVNLAELARRRVFRVEHVQHEDVLAVFFQPCGDGTADIPPGTGAKDIVGYLISLAVFFYRSKQ